ncbi:MAG: helix-turn-helix transcriptional regulator [Clostridia bacterium]
MLSGAELKEFRERRGLSLRDVEAYCDVTNQLISYVENGDKPVTEHNHREICDGINKAYFDKVNGKLKTKDDKKVEDKKPEAKKVK